MFTLREGLVTFEIVSPTFELGFGSPFGRALRTLGGDWSGLLFFLEAGSGLVFGKVWFTLGRVWLTFEKRFGFPFVFL